MIIPLRDPKYISEIVALAKALQPCQQQGLEGLLYRSIGDPQSLVLLSVNDQVTGYVFASLTPWNNEMAALIRSYVNHGVSKDDRAEGWNILTEWAKASGAKRFLAFTQLNPRVFRGFVFAGNIITKELV